MTHEPLQRQPDGMSASRTHATTELQRVNRLFLIAWSALVVVLTVVALAGTSFAQPQLACRGYRPVALSPLGATQQLPQSEATPPAPKNLEAVAARIRYPRVAAHRGDAGTVSAEVLVSEHGQVMHYTVSGEAAPELKQAVAEHIAKLQFEPAQREGQPVRMYVTIPFAFRLK